MPIDQNPELRALSDELNKSAYGETIQEANDKGNCISCKQPALLRCSTEAGRREFYISGLCEICFDRMFSDE